MATGPERGMRRRLAAILAADVVGYSRLIAEDEAGTLARLRALFREVVQPQIARHGGRVFRLLGDSVLAELPSAVEALRCALTVQEAATARAAAEPEADRHVLLRMGLDLGDVAAEGGELHGDGVNVAARLEALAGPGGVLVSAAVRDQARGRLGCGFEDLGPQTLKNIPRPVHAFRALGTTAAALTAATTVAARPDLPSLVVLPFANLGGDPEHDYFADGVTEELTTALARIRWVFVIARNSAFTYKGKAVDVRQVGRELGVRYVVEGSVRRSGARVRVAFQLAEAETGRHVWADRLEGNLAHIFDLQDRVAEAVAGALEPNLRWAEVRRARARPTANLDAYDLYLRALPLHHTATREGNQAAMGLLRRAIALDPDFALAKGLALRCLTRRVGHGWSDPAETGEGLRLVREVLAAHWDEPAALHLAARALAALGADHETALTAVEHALALTPHSADAHNTAGFINAWLCRPDAAIAHLERAVRLIRPASVIDPCPGS